MNASDVTPVLLALQARELAGTVWRVNGRTYRFADLNDPTFGGGGSRESIPIGLYDEQGRLTAYFKSLIGTGLFTKRVARTKWLIAQDLASWGPEFQGAPRQWLDTRFDGRPQGTDFDFTCYLMDVVPGKDWGDLKEMIHDEGVELADDFRWRCVRHLLRALVVLERNGIIHGDVSPNNLRVDLEAAAGKPAAYLIDFDSFVAPAAGELEKLTAEEGGMFGTVGYCPPDLCEETEEERENLAPYSDRYGRDMLVLELFCYDRSLPHDLPPSHWPREVLAERLQRCGVAQAVPYLARPELFDLPESERPSTVELAHSFGMNVPPPVKRRGRASVSTAGLRLRETALETLLRAVVLVLWFLCASHWAIISYKASGWLIPAAPAEIAAAGVVPVGIRLIVAGSLLLGGMFALSCLAFAERQARFVELAGLRVEIPARKSTGRGEQAERGLMALQLAGILAVLIVAVAALIRLG